MPTAQTLTAPTQLTLLFLPLIQEHAPAFRWTYIWLAGGGLLFVLAIVAFTYLIAKRHQVWFGRMLQHPALRAVDEMLSQHFPRIWGFIRGRFSIRQWRGLALTVASVVIFVTVYLFIAITEGWTSEEALYAFDQRIYTWLIDSMNPPTVALMRGITYFGDTVTVLLISSLVGGLLLYRRYRWRLVELIITVGGGMAVMWGLKFVIARSRPEDQLASAVGHSFPSGHAFMSMTLYGYLIYLTWRTVRQDVIRIGVTVLLTVLIFAVGLSRVILRVHWVSDVAGGLTAGLGWLVLGIIASEGIRTYRNQ